MATQKQIEELKPIAEQLTTDAMQGFWDYVNEATHDELMSLESIDDEKMQEYDGEYYRDLEQTLYDLISEELKK